MLLSSKFFRFAFGVSGDKTAVPDDLDPGGAVSYEEGFPPDYELPKTDPSRKPVPRDETNQIYYDISSGVKQYQQDGIPEWIAAADNDGVSYSYRKGVKVLYTGDAGATWNVYRSLVSANTTTPGSDPTKWQLANDLPYASQSTVEALTANNEIVAPVTLGFGFAIDLSANGYIKFPDWLSGVIIQWGTVSSASSGSSNVNTAFTFPLAFPNACRALNALADLSANDRLAYSGSITTTGGTFSVSDTTGGTVQACTIKYTAIGY